jgi:hypothetical protein
MELSALRDRLENLDKPKEAVVYTSYYARMKHIKEADIVPIRIALYAPQYQQKHDCYPALYPAKDLLAAIKAGDIDATEYTKRYNKQLDKLDPMEVYGDLLAIGGGYSVAILCYEKIGDFCHRHLVKLWFKKHGINISEWLQ